MTRYLNALAALAFLVVGTTGAMAREGVQGFNDSQHIVTPTGGTAAQTNAHRDALDLTPYDFAGWNDTCGSDSTAALVALFAATPVGGTARIPVGCWLVSGSGAEIFLLNHPIQIIGDGTGTEVRIASSTSNTTKVFHVFPTANYPGTENFQFRNFRITQQSGNHGLSVIDFDTSGSITSLRNPTISDMLIIQPFGHAITTTYSSGNGTYNLLVSHSVIFGCLYLDGLGDTPTLEENIISGTDCGVYLNQNSGAGGFVARNNNVSADNGAYIIDGGVSPLIEGGEIEQQHANAYGKMIDLNGGSATLTGARIKDIQIQNPAITSSPPTLLTINGSPNTYVDGVRFSQPISVTQPQVVITASAAGTVLGPKNDYINGAGVAATYQTISNSGTGTRGVSAPLAYSAITDGGPVVNTNALTTMKSAVLSVAPLRAGDVIRVRAGGVFTASAAGTTSTTSDLEVDVNDSAMCKLVTTASTNLTNQGWYVQTDIIVRVAGSSGTLQAGSCALGWSGIATGVGVASSLVENVGASQTIAIKTQWSVAAATNSMTLRTATVEVLRAGTAD